MIKLVKLNSKRALNNSWGKAVSQVLILWGTLLFFFLLGGMGYVFFSFDGYLRDLYFPPVEALIFVFITALLLFAVAAPLATGIKNWYYALSLKGEGEDIMFTFLPYASFKVFKKTLLLNLLLFIKKAFIYILFGIVPLGITVFAAILNEDAQTVREIFVSASVFFLGAALLLLSVVFAYTCCLRYYAVHYYFLESGMEDVKGSFAKSKKACDGMKGSLLLFNLSMAGYYILSLCPFTALYFYPVLQSAKAIYGRYLIERCEGNI